MTSNDNSQAKQTTQLKIPKGTRDWYGRELLLRDYIFSTISTVLDRHGGIPLDTPVFELRDILSEKYGEDGKLIYNLEDQGGEATSLRYDLTVPFAKWLAMNPQVPDVKRYQIAKVYRRDQPAVARGRMREFNQCDFDITGRYDPMLPDAEIIRIIDESFEALQFGVTVKLNHRKILDGLFQVAGVPDDKIRPTSSAVDKLDKAPWEEVKLELLEKGLTEDVAGRVGRYVQSKGTMKEMLDAWSKEEDITANTSVAEGLTDLKLLASYLEAMGVLEIVSFDLSLARGLDYYTGLIYEVVPNENAGPNQVGSIAAGGRYDNLVGMYGRKQVPCVGISFGVDRIFTLLLARQEEEEAAKRKKKTKAITEFSHDTDVFIMALGGKGFTGLINERIAVAKQLWDAGIRAEYAQKVKPKPQQQFNASDDTSAVLGVILGEDEIAAGQVRVKRLGFGKKTNEEEGGDNKSKGKDELVNKADLVEKVKEMLAAAKSEQPLPIWQAGDYSGG